MLYADKGDVARAVELVFVAARTLKDEDGLRVMSRSNLKKAAEVYEIVLRAISVASELDEPIYQIRPETMVSDDPALWGF